MCEYEKDDEVDCQAARSVRVADAGSRQESSLQRSFTSLLWARGLVQPLHLHWARGLVQPLHLHWARGLVQPLHLHWARGLASGKGPNEKCERPGSVESKVAPSKYRKFFTGFAIVPEVSRIEQGHRRAGEDEPASGSEMEQGMGELLPGARPGVCTQVLLGPPELAETLVLRALCPHSPHPPTPP
eukprot:gene17985-biopygen12408